MGYAALKNAINNKNEEYKVDIIHSQLMSPDDSGSPGVTSNYQYL